MLYLYIAETNRLWHTQMRQTERYSTRNNEKQFSTFKIVCMTFLFHVHRQHRFPRTLQGDYIANTYHTLP